MNIRQAKEEVAHAVEVYLAKDDNGSYLIPIERQRPLFLLGAPGLGKTAIMEQVAQEMGIGLVSYSMTHHTRQSALGLPYIAERTFEGRSFSVSEYTMSEIDRLDIRKHGAYGPKGRNLIPRRNQLRL